MNQINKHLLWHVALYAVIFGITFVVLDSSSDLISWFILSLDLHPRTITTLPRQSLGTPRPPSRFRHRNTALPSVQHIADRAASTPTLGTTQTLKFWRPTFAAVGIATTLGLVALQKHRRGISMAATHGTRKDMALPPELADSPQSYEVLLNAWQTDPDIRAAQDAGLAIQRRAVRYHDGGTALQGYVAWPEGPTVMPLPLILMVHAAPGPHELFNLWKMEALASLGYVVFAVDMFGLEHPVWDSAVFQQLRDHLCADRRVLRARILSALRPETLAEVRAVLGPQCALDATNVAAVGYCFGGRTVLDLARCHVKDLRGVVSFHGALDDGGLPLEEPPIPLKTSVLVHHGGSDPLISPGQRAAFLAEMSARQAPLEFVEHPGVLHAFTRPEKVLEKNRAAGFGYDAAVASAAWASMKGFLARVLEKPPPLL